MDIQANAAQIDAATDLESAVRLQDAELAMEAIGRAYAAGLHPLHTKFLIILLEAPWHLRHEDVAFSLQQLRSPDAVDALERTAHAHYDYLDYDEFFGLARKCTWALADIGTPEAQEALTRLEGSKNELIARYARKRLINWQSEMDRKGR